MELGRVSGHLGLVALPALGFKEPCNGSVLEGLRDHMVQSLPFTDEETEAQRTVGGFLKEVVLGWGTEPAPFPNCCLLAGSRLRQTCDVLDIIVQACNEGRGALAQTSAHAWQTR